MGATLPESLPEAERNDLLRQVDWRFLLDNTGQPRALDLSRGRRLSRAIDLIAERAPDAPGAADLVVLGYPTRRGLTAAAEVAAPGAAIVCEWRVPRFAGMQRARRRLERAGLASVCVYWPGPLPHRPPQFWLPLGSPAARARLFSLRPARSPAQAALRALWHTIANLGLLAPAVAIGYAAGGEGDSGRGNGHRDVAKSGQTASMAGGSPLLLTGGARSINKVVALGDSAEGTPVAVKFARVPEADAALEREAEVLRQVQREHPTAPGVPRLLDQGRRAGRRAIAESAVNGRPLIDSLSEETFPRLASQVSEWLVELARGGDRQAPADWWPRLVAEPLRRFEESFAPVLAPDTARRARQLLEDLGELPQTCEHRDCSPWNIVLSAGGEPALLDWESAEPHGLPGLDLAYFLANAAFVLDGALESGDSAASLANLLDPSNPRGTVATSCIGEYCAGLGLDPGAFPRLRLLAWIVHSQSDYRHISMESAGQPPPEALRGSVFLGLIEQELRLSEGDGRDLP